MARRLKAADDAARASAHLPQSIPAGPAVDRNKLLPGHPARHDGWTQERTQRFLDALGHTGCVRDASRIAGLSNTAAYRLKARYPLFSDAWDKAMARAQQGLIAIAYKRAVEGRETVIIRKGEEVERRIAPSDSMLGLLIKRGDLREASGVEAIPEGHIVVDPSTVISFAEMEAGWHFDAHGIKRDMADIVELARKFEARFEEMRCRMFNPIFAKTWCPHCQQRITKEGQAEWSRDLCSLPEDDADWTG